MVHHERVKGTHNRKKGTFQSFSSWWAWEKTTEPYINGLRDYFFGLLESSQRHHNQHHHSGGGKKGAAKKIH